MGFLTEPFAERLGVFDDDAPCVVLAKVIWQVSAVIRKVTRDSKWITVLDATYNLSQDPELNSLDLKGRLEELKRRHGAGWDPSTTNSKLSELRPEVIRRLEGRLDWPPEHKIEELARSEEAYASGQGQGQAPGDRRTIVLPEDAAGQLIADMNRSGRRTLDFALPRLSLHFAVSAKGNLVTTQTAEFGETLAVFTSEGLLRQYLAEVRASESEVPVTDVGRRIIDVLVARGRVGLVVNPLGGHGGHGGQHWTAEELGGL